MYKYENNAFRILGLLPSATIQDILARTNEIKVKTSIGLDVVYDNDALWIGPLDRSNQSVINALQRLENPMERLMEEILWFWIENEQDRLALSHIAKNEKRLAHAIWEEQDIALPLKKVKATHNRAILAHCSVISKESSIAYTDNVQEKKILIKEETEDMLCPNCQKLYDIKWRVCTDCGVDLVKHKNERKEMVVKTRGSTDKLSDRHWNNWRYALTKYIELNTSDVFWTEISKRIKAINDARLPESKIGEIKKTFLSIATEPNFEYIAKSLSNKDYERAQWHSNLLNGIGLPSQILKEGFNNVLSARMESLNQYCNEIKNEIAKFMEDHRKEIAYEVISKIIGQIRDITYEGNLIDINNISDYALAKDNIAEALVYLSDQVFKRYGDYQKAYELITESVNCAASSYLKQRYKKYAEIVRYNLSHAESTNKQESSSNGQPNSITGSIMKHPLAWTLLAIACLISVISLFTSPSENVNKAGNVPNELNNTNTISNYSYPSVLKAKIEKMEVSLNNKIEVLNDIEAQMAVKQREMESIKSYLSEVASKYNQYSIPDDIAKEYHNKVNKYNDILVPSYNRLLNKSKRIYNEYKKEKMEYDDLIKLYNSMIK